MTKNPKATAKAKAAPKATAKKTARKKAAPRAKKVAPLATKVEVKAAPEAVKPQSHRKVGVALFALGILIGIAIMLPDGHEATPVAVEAPQILEEVDSSKEHGSFLSVNALNVELDREISDRSALQGAVSVAGLLPAPGLQGRLAKSSREADDNIQSLKGLLDDAQALEEEKEFLSLIRGMFQV